jgi:hypothetical protein
MAGRTLRRLCRPDAVRRGHPAVWGDGRVLGIVMTSGGLEPRRLQEMAWGTGRRRYDFFFGSTQLDGFGRGGYLFAVFWVTSAVLFGLAR